MTDREKKCEELIASRLAGRLADLLPDWDDEEAVTELAKEFDLENTDTYEVRDAHRDRASEGVLSVEVRKLYRVLLSFGGPSDGFDFVFNQDGDLIECEYFYHDWFDGAKRRVDMDQAEELAQLYCVGPEFE